MGEHDWLGIAGIAGIAVGVLGMLVAGYFALKQKQKVQITYSIDKTQLLGGERGVIPHEITIIDKNPKITDLPKFNAIFGILEIRRSDAKILSNPYSFLCPPRPIFLRNLF